MGFLIDSSVLIAVERGDLDMASIRKSSGSEPVALSAVTASELLHGVHRADSHQRRRRRELFVEDLLARFPVIPFDLRVARTHSALWADLAAKGRIVGAHDLQIAATALAHGFSVATRDRRHFHRVEGLTVSIW